MGDPYRKIVQLAAVASPLGDVRDEDMRRAMRKDPTATPAAAHTARIWIDTLRREFLQSFVVARCSSAVVEKILEIPAPVYQLFCIYGFDLDEFDDRTDLCAWVSRYEPDTTQGRTKPGRQLLELAMFGGEELLRARFDPDYVVPPERVVRAAMTDAFARGHGIRAIDGKKAAHIATTSLKLALEASKSIDKGNPEDDLAKLLLNIRARREDTPVQSIKGTVLH